MSLNKHKIITKVFVRTFCLLLLCVFSISSANSQVIQNPQIIGHNSNQTLQAHRDITPRFSYQGRLQNQSKFIHPAFFSAISELTKKTLDDTFLELQRIFLFTPKNKIAVKLVSPQEFVERTSAPSWTSAMYLRGNIFIPIDAKLAQDFGRLKRSVRHEYIHAVIGEISKHRCPAWLDEGLAQFIEGAPNQLVEPALKEWLKSNPPIRLAVLNQGFADLPKEIVPVAYGQSLMASRRLININGFSAVRRYLTLLGNNISEEQAFKHAFGLEFSDFEEKFNSQLERYS